MVESGPADSETLLFRTELPQADKSLETKKRKQQSRIPLAVFL